MRRKEDSSVRTYEYVINVSAAPCEACRKHDLRPRRKRLDQLVTNLVIQEPLQLLLVYFLHYTSLVNGHSGSTRTGAAAFANNSHNIVLLLRGGSFSYVPLAQAMSVLMDPGQRRNQSVRHASGGNRLMPYSALNSWFSFMKSAIFGIVRGLPEPFLPR